MAQKAVKLDEAVEEGTRRGAGAVLHGSRHPVEGHQTLDAVEHEPAAEGEVEARERCSGEPFPLFSDEEEQDEIEEGPDLISRLVPMEEVARGTEEGGCPSEPPQIRGGGSPPSKERSVKRRAS